MKKHDGRLKEYVGLPFYAAYIAACVLWPLPIVAADKSTSEMAALLPGRLAFERRLASVRIEGKGMAEILLDLGLTDFVVFGSARSKEPTVGPPYTFVEVHPGVRIALHTPYAFVHLGPGVRSVTLPKEYIDVRVSLVMTNVTCLTAAQKVFSELGIGSSLSPWGDVVYFGPKAEVLRAQTIGQLLHSEYREAVGPVRAMVREHCPNPLWGECEDFNDTAHLDSNGVPLPASQSVPRVISQVSSEVGWRRRHICYHICRGSALWIALVLADVELRKVGNELHIVPASAPPVAGEIPQEHIQRSGKDN